MAHETLGYLSQSPIFNTTCTITKLLTRLTIISVALCAITSIPGEPRCIDVPPVLLIPSRKTYPSQLMGSIASRTRRLVSFGMSATLEQVRRIYSFMPCLCSFYSSRSYLILSTRNPGRPHKSNSNVIGSSFLLRSLSKLLTSRSLAIKR